MPRGLEELLCIGGYCIKNLGLRGELGIVF